MYIPFLFVLGVTSSAHGLTTGSGMSNSITNTSGIPASEPSVESYDDQHSIVE